jgi:signal transduction histidine kinase
MPVAGNGPSTPVDVVHDAGRALGDLAGALVGGADLSAALQVLVDQLGLRSAAIRSSAGELVGVAGDAVRALSAPVLEIAVPVLAGVEATLTVAGARPSQVTALRSAASILGLALGQRSAADLLDVAEYDRDELADALHDGPVQSLVVARFTADMAVRGADARAARDAVQEALVGLRRQLWQIRTRGSQGLAAALEQLSAQRMAAGRQALGLVLEADLDGTAAVLAYRVVQAVSNEDGPVRVAVRRDGDAVVIDIDATGPLLSPDRWVLRARALGGDLSSTAGRLRLVLPPRSDEAKATR